MTKLGAATTAFVSRLKEGSLAAIPAGDPALRRASVRIGARFQLLTVANVTRQRLIDTGNLRRSIQYRVLPSARGMKIEFGSYGVRYAGVHEFGYNGVVKVRGHTRRGFEVRPHDRQVNIIARPFVGPALRTGAPFVQQVMRDLVFKRRG